MRTLTVTGRRRSALLAQDEPARRNQVEFGWRLLAKIAVQLSGANFEHSNMTSATKCQTSLTSDSEALDYVKALDINVSAVAEAALRNAVASGLRAQWLEQNAAAFEAQSASHERHGHPLVDIMSAPGGSSWSTTRPNTTA